MPANASRPTATEVEKAIQRVLAHFAAHHRTEVQEQVTKLLTEATSTITEANLTIVGIASRTWPLENVRNVIADVPKIGSAVRVDPLDARTLQRELAETISGFQPAIQARLIKSLIATASYDAIKYVPERRLDQQSLAFALAFADNISHTSVSFKKYELSAEAFDSATDEDRLLELVFENGPAAWAAITSPKLTMNGLTKILNYNPDNSDVILACPVSPPQLVDQHFTAQSERYAASANASPQKLHEIISGLITSGAETAALPKFLSNPNTSSDTLVWAADQLDETSRAAECMPVICRHRNLPSDRANEQVAKYMTMGFIDLAFPYNASQFTLMCAGHPELHPRLQARLFEEYEWESLHYLNLTDHVIERITDRQLHFAIATFEARDIPIFDRIVELDHQNAFKRLAQHEWLALVTATPEGAAWAVTSPNAPQGISTRYAAEALVAEQSEIWKRFPDARTAAVLPTTKWTELTRPERRRFNYAHAVLTEPGIDHEGVTYTALCTEQAIEQLPANYRIVAREALRAANIVAVAAQQHIVKGIGIFRADAGNTRLVDTCFINADGQRMPLQGKLETGFYILTNTWNEAQIEYVKSQTIAQPPEPPTL